MAKQETERNTPKKPFSPGLPHSKDGIHHLRYGVMAARKGGLTAAGCLNALGVEAFAQRVGLFADGG